MFKAVGYTRKSTKDQSHFSIEFQDSIINGFGKEKNIDIVKIFTDDGYSAKNFDRPNWQDLEKFIKENYREINYLIVAKYDRFGRNVVQSLQKIELIEKRYNIRIVSVLENIGLHPDSPYFFKIRTDMLTGAQTEWLQIRDRTRQGIRQAKLNGRTVNSAPIGYKNTRDEKNLPIIVLDPVKAPYVRRIFDLFLAGHEPVEIYRKVKSEGLNLRSRTIIMKILANPTYGGIVYVKPLYDNPGKYVKAIHEPIVSEEIWWKTQALLSHRPKKNKVKIDERFPLRGVVTYTNGAYLTSYYASGKTKKVPYYRVFKPDKSFNADRMHSMMDEILKNCSLNAMQVNYLKESIYRQIEIVQKDNNNALHKRRQELKRVIERMHNLEEDRIDRVIEKDEYLKWRFHFVNEKEALENEISLLIQPGYDIYNKLNATIPLLGDVQYLYQIAGVEAKQEMLKGVFDKGISYDGFIYRTPYINDIFSSKTLILKEKRLLEIEQSFVNLGSDVTKYHVGVDYLTIHKLIDLFIEIKNSA